MNKRIKILITILLFCLLCFVLFYCLSRKNIVSVNIFYSETEKLDIQAKFSGNSVQSSVKAYHDQMGDYYLFLPAHSEGKRISFNISDTVQENNFLKWEKGDLSDYQKYYFNDGKTLHILVGKGIPSVFIDLKKDLSYIASDKEKEDSGQIAFFDENGMVCYKGALEEIQGRGNATWDLRKKPYNIKLGNEVSLYGFSEEKNYSLISSYDDSFVRNMISDEIADTLGIARMGRKHINLYINGEYQGVYELCEQITASALEIKDIQTNYKDNIKKDPSLKQVTTEGFIEDNGPTPTGKWWEWSNSEQNEVIGGYILEADITARYQEEKSGFYINTGAFMVTKEPTYLSEEQYKYISSYVQICEDKMYEALTNQDITDLSSYIDVDSFVGKYLLEEVSKNLDSASTSQYFYMNNNNVLTAGPIWDYDRAYGCYITKDGYDIDFNSPVGFSAKEVPGDFQWWQILYYQKDFYEKVVTTYRNKLYPFLKKFTETSIYSIEDYLNESATMDYIRWQRLTTVEEAKRGYYDTVVEVNNFLKERIEFLNREWNK